MDLSLYALGLDTIHKKRYLDKIQMIGVDPYLVDISSFSNSIMDFPKILYPDIVMYLVNTKSAYTMQDMKAYKSLEAYKFSTCGWVKKIVVKRFGMYCLILGKVMHSQRLSEKPLSPWIIAQINGSVINAHCDCVAGLGEVCSHVAAILFSIDEAVRKTEEVSRTGVKAYWMPPSNRPVEPGQVAELSFLSPKKRKECNEEPLVYRETDENKGNLEVPPISSQEKHVLLTQLASTQGSALHLITKPFADIIHKEMDTMMNKSIINLFNPDYKHKTLLELQEIGAEVNFTISAEECRKIERETIDQSKCKAWFIYRAGRITASTFKSCCRTKIEQPSISLIKSICYPPTHKHKIRALEYGCLHESDALKAFSKEMRKNHVNFKIAAAGFCINPKYPYFGASPDGVADCDCCGTSLIEVKCPYCARLAGVTSLLNKKSFMKIKEGNMVLKKDLTYYYQIQMQMALTGRENCYFIAWSKKDFAYAKVCFDSLFWEEQSQIAKNFFFKIVLPEALGKYFTRQGDSISDENQETETEEIDLYEEIITTESAEMVQVEDEQPGPSKPTLWCVCLKEDDKIQPMIECLNGTSCKIQWYHLKCIGLQQVPEALWICNACKSKYL